MGLHLGMSSYPFIPILSMLSWCGFLAPSRSTVATYSRFGNPRSRFSFLMVFLRPRLPINGFQALLGFNHQLQLNTQNLVHMMSIYDLAIGPTPRSLNPTTLVVCQPHRFGLSYSRPNLWDINTKLLYLSALAYVVPPNRHAFHSSYHSS